MQVKVHEIGNDKSRVVVIDDFLPDARPAVAAAVALAPFPAENQTYYPGVRRFITPEDTEADAYVVEVLENASQFIGGVFDADSFDFVEASFSIVNRRPEDLIGVQRLPHSDSTDPRFLAVLHYLNDIPGTGTCFYRHRASGFEQITKDRAGAYAISQSADESRFGIPDKAFFNDSDSRYEKLLQVEGRFNRLVIYQGSLLHSGLIPENFAFSDDPATGRLTGNIFVTAK